MRARNLKPGFFKNPELADAGPIVQLLFAGLWLLADKEGRLKDQPRVIKAEVFPYYPVDVNGELTVLQRLGHIHRFVVDGTAVIEVVNFRKHQSPHHTERASDLPAFVGNYSVREIHGETTVDSPLDNGGNPSDSLILRFSDSLIHDSLNHDSKNGDAQTHAKQPARRRRSSEGGRKPTRRVPDDFVPDADWALEVLPDLDVTCEIQKFRDCEFRNPHRDWAATWRTWVRNNRDTGRYARLVRVAKTVAELEAEELINAHR
jgi:hypothetical protein